MAIYDRSDYKGNYNKGGYNRKPFAPKKPVHTFRDLEVYQKTLECAVLIVKNFNPKLARLKFEFLENMTNCALSIPLYIGEGHSMRFGDFGAGVGLLEKAMASSNKIIIYLEIAKGLYGAKIDAELADDIIGRYAECRGKMFRLEKSWKKFHAEFPEGKFADKSAQVPRY